MKGMLQGTMSVCFRILPHHLHPIWGSAYRTRALTWAWAPPRTEALFSHRHSPFSSFATSFNMLGKLYLSVNAGEPRRTRVILLEKLVKKYNLPIEISDPDAYYPSQFPRKVVPGFRWADGTILTESIAITLMVLEQIPNRGGLAGANDIKSMASITQWMLFLNYDLMESIATVFCMLIGRYEKDAVIYRYHEQKVSNAVSILEKHLSDRNYLVGDSLTIADLYGVQMFYRGLEYLFDTEWRASHPNIFTWWKRCSQEPIWDGFFDNLKFLEKYQPLF